MSYLFKVSPKHGHVVYHLCLMFISTNDVLIGKEFKFKHVKRPRILKSMDKMDFELKYYN